MASISIGKSIGEGFGIIARRPLTVLAWGALRVGCSVVLLAIMWPMLSSMMSSMSAMRAAQGSSPTAAMASLGPMFRSEGEIMLVSLVGGIVSLVVYCAAFRAVLKPEAPTFAFLRFGAAELFLLLFGFGFYFALILGLIAVMIPIGIIAGIAGVAHAPLVSGLLFVVGFVGAIAFCIWILVRLSLVGAMTVQDGMFHLGDAWRLTKGHGWSLFGLGLALFCIAILIGIVQAVVSLATGGFDLMTVMSSANNPAAMFNTATPFTLPRMIGFVVSVPIIGCEVAILASPWARAYRDLAQPGVAETFA